MRRLDELEVEDLLFSDTVARLATIDSHGYPHVTPIWFLWVDGVFYLTSYAGRPHLDRIVRNPRVGLVIDVEAALRPDGERPNKQVRVIGDATVSPDRGSVWTARIRTKYVDAVTLAAQHAAHRERALITVVPRTITAVASI
ncbi:MULTISPECIES: pyridoxamine 5'-phosphate oxidase family protein [Nocardia]|uniref:pyridoxamine 5'-phosphate oxidase family protein n=1 Tax=Nocardia TaxID=1817 RepID=UPI00031F8FD0|nr:MULTISPECIES: pyridoxamine 5'-phosphate oxidase family protein [Nocardia]